MDLDNLEKSFGMTLLRGKDKHFYSILSSDFREDEFLSEEYFGFWLALTVLPSKRFARDYQIHEGFMLVHEEEKCFSLHKLEALTKTFQHLKQWQPTLLFLHCLLKVWE